MAAASSACAIAASKSGRRGVRCRSSAITPSSTLRISSRSLTSNMMRSALVRKVLNASSVGWPRSARSRTDAEESTEETRRLRSCTSISMNCCRARSISSSSRRRERSSLQAIVSSMPEQDSMASSGATAGSTYSSVRRMVM